MKDQTTVITVTVILAVAIVFGFYKYSQHNRYVIVSSDKVAYQLDRFTGEAWLLAGGTRIKIVADEKQ